MNDSLVKSLEFKIYAKNVEIASQNKNLSKQKKIEHKLFIKNIKTDGDKFLQKR